MIVATAKPPNVASTLTQTSLVKTSQTPQLAVNTIAPPKPQTPSYAPKLVAPTPKKSGFGFLQAFNFGKLAGTQSNRNTFGLLTNDIAAKDVTINRQSQAIGNFQGKVNSLQNQPQSGGFSLPDWAIPAGIGIAALLVIMLKRK